MIGVIAYSTHALRYRLRFSARETLAISVYPDGTIEVIAPNGTVREEVESRLRKRARWILRQLLFFEQFRPRSPERRYVGGETHLYLGRQYRLKLTKGKMDEVKLKGAYLHVTSPVGDDPNHVKCLVTQWYRKKAEPRLNERFEVISRRVKRSACAPSPPILRSMTRRWGSFNKAGRVLLNPDLIRAPTTCIDYVIAHELTHLIHPNHGADFYEMLEALMPDWRHRKARLEHVLS